MHPSTGLGMAGAKPLKVALDAGHGARAGRPHTGAAANGLVEDDLALDLVARIGHHLRAAGHQTVVTRPDTKLVGLSERARTARAASCDAFLSIHCNAGPTAACGAEAFAASGDRRSRTLAERLIAALAEQGLRNRGVKWDSQSQYSRLGVLRGTYRHMPSVLLEVGFLTSPYDAGLLRDAHWREETAIVVAQSLISACDRLR